jgi:hypothetical protein
MPAATANPTAADAKAATRRRTTNDEPGKKKIVKSHIIELALLSKTVVS